MLTIRSTVMQGNVAPTVRHLLQDIHNIRRLQGKLICLLPDVGVDGLDLWECGTVSVGGGIKASHQGV